MCGRYATTRNSIDLAVLFEALDDTGGALVPDYNVAPTDPVPVVLMGTGGRTLLDRALGTRTAVGAGRPDRCSDDQRARRDSDEYECVRALVPAAAVSRTG